MGHPLLTALEKKERSAAWLGRKTGKSASYVTRVIAGERRPSREFREAAAQALEIPAELLFPGEKEGEAAS